MEYFTNTELFGWFVPMPNGDTWDTPKPCLKCGAAVFIPDLHRKWHDGNHALITAVELIAARVS